MIWTGVEGSSGYGTLNHRLAHVLSFEHFNGSVPKGHVVRHTCDVKLCIAPDHLIDGTQKQNMQDAADRGRIHGQGVYKERCSNGHEMTEDNVRTTKRNGRTRRQCRE